MRLPINAHMEVAAMRDYGEGETGKRGTQMYE
jgi:hypothetical protein